MALIIQGTSAITLPKGTTLERPPTPVIGMVRVNTTTNALEVYSGTAWITWKAF